MAKKKKRDAVTLVSLLLALVALLVGYLWYMHRDKMSSDSEDTQKISLATINTEQVTTVHYVAKDADLTLILENEKWILQEEPDRPINQNYVKNIINVVKEVTATKLVNEGPENIDEYGLRNPTAFVEVVQSDGKTIKLRIGNEAATGEGYYAQVNDDVKVYLVNSSYGTRLSYSNDAMTAVEEAPKINSENIRYLDIVNFEGKGFELLYKEDNNLDYSGSNLYPWMLLKPYGEGYSAESSKVNELLSNYTNFDYVTCVDYKGENLSLYGLDQPKASVVIGYNEPHSESLDQPEKDPITGEETTEKTTYEPKEFHLSIGDLDENGSYYYVRMEGANSVYTMGTSDVEKLFQVNAFDLLNKFIAIPNIETVDRIDVDIDGNSYTMELKRSKTREEDGVEETVTTYYCNGKEVEEEAFKDLYQVMITAKYDVESKEELKKDGLKPYMTISYHIFGANETTLTTSYLPYDESFYAVDTGYNVRFFADKRKIEEIAKAITEFK